MTGRPVECSAASVAAVPALVRRFFEGFEELFQCEPAHRQHPLERVPNLVVGRGSAGGDPDFELSRRQPIALGQDLVAPGGLMGDGPGGGVDAGGIFDVKGAGVVRADLGQVVAGPETLIKS